MSTRSGRPPKGKEVSPTKSSSLSASSDGTNSTTPFGVSGATSPLPLNPTTPLNNPVSSLDPVPPVDTNELLIEMMRMIIQKLDTPVPTHPIPGIPIPKPPIPITPPDFDSQRFRHKTKLRLPKKFNGDSSSFRNFEGELMEYFALSDGDQLSDCQQTAILGNLLSGTAHSWYRELVHADLPKLYNFNQFLILFRSIFSDHNLADKKIMEIEKIKQGKLPIRNFINEFRILAIQAPITEYMKICYFTLSVNSKIFDIITLFETPNTLEEAFTMAIKAEERTSLRALRRPNKETIPIPEGRNRTPAPPRDSPSPTPPSNPTNPYPNKETSTPNSSTPL